jgi:hypothetical protein
MRLKGINYDVGRVLGVNRRAVFHSDVTQGTYSHLAVPFNGQSRG